MKAGESWLKLNLNLFVRNVVMKQPNGLANALPATSGTPLLKNLKVKQATLKAKGASARVKLKE